MFLILNIPVFTQISRALLSGLLPYIPVLHFNPCPQSVRHHVFAQNHLRYSGKTNGARASEAGLSGKANQLR